MFGLPFVTVADSASLAEPHVALRHDVDWSIENAYAMAIVEHQLGIRSSYYLLHPDGRVTSRNYFGQVSDGRLAIDPQLFDWAARLMDLGHEVGLHNDLISLALATRRQPGEFLEQIVEAFAERGMPLAGSVAHGSRQCRDLGYLNYQIFAELKHEDVALDYRDRPELFERFREAAASQSMVMASRSSRCAWPTSACATRPTSCRARSTSRTARRAGRCGTTPTRCGWRSSRRANASEMLSPRHCSASGRAAACSAWCTPATGARWRTRTHRRCRRCAVS